MPSRFLPFPAWSPATFMLLLLAFTVFPPASLAQALDRVATPASPAWMRIEGSMVPLRSTTARNADILGFANKGEVLRVEKQGTDWIKLRLNPTVSGWVQRSQVSESGPPTHWDRRLLKGSLLALFGLGLLVFMAFAIRLYLTRRSESRERTRQALLDAKRRLQNKVQLLFRAEPRIPSHLVQGEVDLLEFLRNIGYIAKLEKEPSEFLPASKAFKPNLLIASADFRDRVEALVETDATLINTPVIYLNTERAGTPHPSRIRAYLETNATDKELGEAMAHCLKQSPERIQYSVKPMALKGDVAAGTLVDLLQFLAAVKRSGQLIATTGPNRGEVYLQSGEIVKASMRGMSGERAVESLLSLVSGTFEFHEKSVESMQGNPINTQKLLLDWARTQDENNHRSGT